MCLGTRLASATPRVMSRDGRRVAACSHRYHGGCYAMSAMRMLHLFSYSTTSHAPLVSDSPRSSNCLPRKAAILSIPYTLHPASSSTWSLLRPPPSRHNRFLLPLQPFFNLNRGRPRIPPLLSPRPPQARGWQQTSTLLRMA